MVHRFQLKSALRRADTQAMRRLTALAMVLALVCGLAGCRGSPDGSSSVSSSSSGSSSVEGDMELAKEVATALGQKATAAFRWENCPSEEGCTYHEPTTFEINEKGGCSYGAEAPYNWTCNFIEVNEAGRGAPNNWLVDKEANGCWKVVELDEHSKWERGGKTLNEYEREGEHSKPQEPETPYVENCTQSGRASIGRAGRLVPATSEQSESTPTTQTESTETTPTTSTPEASTEAPASSSSSACGTIALTQVESRPLKVTVVKGRVSCAEARSVLQALYVGDRGRPRCEHGGEVCDRAETYYLIGGWQCGTGAGGGGCSKGPEKQDQIGGEFRTQ